MKVRKPTRFLFAVGLMASLAACSSNGSDPLVDSIRAIGTQLTENDSAARDARTTLTPAIVAATQQPYLLVELPSRQASATRFMFNQSGAIQDWRGEDGIALLLQNDVLVGTRGLGADLFASDPIPPGALQTLSKTPYIRTFRHLDGENRETITPYRCSLRLDGTAEVDLIARQVETWHIVEVCQGTDPSRASVVENEFWLGKGDNVIWKSKQWVSESVAYATLYYLVR